MFTVFLAGGYIAIAISDASFYTEEPLATALTILGIWILGLMGICCGMKTGGAMEALGGD